MFKCQHCEKSFNTILALNGHSRMHGKSNGKLPKKEVKIFWCEETQTYKSKRGIKLVEEYLKNPKFCKRCGIQIKYSSKSQNHCSRSCGNVREHSEITKQKIKQTLLNRNINSVTKIDLKKKTIRVKLNCDKNIGPNSKIYKMTCSHCNMLFYHKQQMKYCQNCKSLYKSNNRNRYAFTFNVYNYPDLFDLSLIEKYGWHSHGGRYNYNPTGLTRDHKISVNDAIKNNYDPYYIKHPLNCQLMSFEENNKKKTKSSMTYQELVRLVDQYDIKEQSFGESTRTTIPNQGNTPS